MAEIAGVTLKMPEEHSIDQKQLTAILCGRPQNMAWFLGAGASRSAGLPSAADILWDLKRHYYCREESQEITRQDIQNDAVRARIQTFMESRGFPAEWADREYETYFEKLFGAEKDKQRQYLSRVLSDEKVRLTSGHRVLGAMMKLGLCRVTFTTNFDNVVEKAAAFMGDQAVTAYHLEGAHNAKRALDNEEYPFYCKLHGDFRYDSLKNLPSDLEAQDGDLSQCLINAGNRFGFIVIGYSGRDASIIDLFTKVLETTNPFPHGLYWTYLKGSELRGSVIDLIETARSKGVNASAVPIETFDSLMTRLWRNLDGKTAELDSKVRRTAATTVSIPLPGAGKAKPLIRLNALPVLTIPRKCQALTFKRQKEWADLRQVQRDTEFRTFFTKSDSVWSWGSESDLRTAFGSDLTAVGEAEIPEDLNGPGTLHVKGFIEEALCAALSRGRPLLSRKLRTGALLIVDPHATDIGALEPLTQVVGKCHGTLAGVFAPATDDHPQPEKMAWAESCRVSLDYKGGALWVQLDPDVWIWPPRARKLAQTFLDERRGNRFNNIYNQLLNAWIEIIFESSERNIEIDVSAFDGGSEAENPKFRLSNRTAFARRLSA